MALCAEVLIVREDGHVVQNRWRSGRVVALLERRGWEIGRKQLLVLNGE
jgi:hypothetical protein